MPYSNSGLRMICQQFQKHYNYKSKRERHLLLQKTSNRTAPHRIAQRENGRNENNLCGCRQFFYVCSVGRPTSRSLTCRLGRRPWMSEHLRHFHQITQHQQQQQQPHFNAGPKWGAEKNSISIIQLCVQNVCCSTRHVRTRRPWLQHMLCLTRNIICWKHTKPKKEGLR